MYSTWFIYSPKPQCKPHARGIRQRVVAESRSMSLVLAAEYAAGAAMTDLVARKLATDRGIDTVVWGFATVWFIWIVFTRQVAFLLAWYPATWSRWPEGTWTLGEKTSWLLGGLGLVTFALVDWSVSMVKLHEGPPQIDALAHGTYRRGVAQRSRDATGAPLSRYERIG